MSRSQILDYFSSSVGYFWTSDRAGVDHSLRRSVETGLVVTDSAHSDDQDNPDPIYRLTRRGQAVFEDWLVSPVESYPVRAPFLLRLFFAGRLDPGLISGLIAVHLDAVSEQLAELQKINADIGRHLSREDLPLTDRLRLSTLDRGIAYAETELRWVNGLQDELAVVEPAPAPAAST